MPPGPTSVIWEAEKWFERKRGAPHGGERQAPVENEKEVFVGGGRPKYGKGPCGLEV